MTPQQNIQQRLLSLDSNYQDFILSDYFAEIRSVFIDTQNLEGKKSDILENGFVLLMTFFIDRPEFVLFVEKQCGIPRRDGELLVEGFIQALPTPIVNAYEEIYKETFSTPSNTLESDILEAEAVLNTIPKPLPLPQEAVYTSTQSAILAEAKVVPTPVPVSAPTAVPLPPPPSSTPRWDTEK